MCKKVLVLLGPNLNMLGKRENVHYGAKNFKDLKELIIKKAEFLNFNCEIYQSNSEGNIINKIHKEAESFDFIILNAGALSHYSYSLRDAINSVNTPCIEVHMSNIFKREDFRKNSVISEVCQGQIVGFKENVYLLALDLIKYTK